VHRSATTPAAEIALQQHVRRSPRNTTKGDSRRATARVAAAARQRHGRRPVHCSATTRAAAAALQKQVRQSPHTTTETGNRRKITSVEAAARRQQKRWPVNRSAATRTVAAVHQQQVWGPPQQTTNGGRRQTAQQEHARLPPLCFNTCGSRQATPQKVAVAGQQTVWRTPRGSKKNDGQCAAPQRHLRRLPLCKNTCGGRRTPPLLYQLQRGYLNWREVTTVRATHATPAKGLELREVGPIETVRHEDTVYLPATTVPFTVVALRPEGAEPVTQAQFPLMGINPGHKPTPIIPSMHVRSPGAILTRRGRVIVPRATRCTRLLAPSQPAPAAPSRTRQPGSRWGPRAARRRVGYAPPASWIGRRGRPHRPRPRVAVLPLASRPPRRVPRLRRCRRSHGRPRHIGSPHCSTSILAGMKPSPETFLAIPVGAPSPALAGRLSTSATAPGVATAPAAPAMPGPTGHRPAVPVRPSVPLGLRLPYDPNGRPWRRSPRPAGVVAEAGAGAEAATSPASGAATDPASAPGGGPASAPEKRPTLLGQAAPALPPLSVPPAVRA